MLKTNTEELQKILAKVQALPEAGGETIEPVIEELNITENGTYTAPDGVDGYSPINVNVPIPEGYIKPNGSLDINTNGTYDVTEKASVNVDVKPILQNKTVTPTKEEQDITADEVYDGLSKVTVNAIPNEYIIPSGTQEITENGTYDVTEKASVNVNVANTEVTPILQEKTVSPTTSSQSVTPDNGYDGLSKVTVNPMPTATQATPTISIDNNGLITASATQSAGYVASGTKKSTKQLSICEGRTITPSAETQIAITEGQYATGDIDIEGDDRLVPANIKSGVTIFGVTGTYEGSGGSGGGSTGTCNVTINTASGVRVIGWGEFTVTSDGNTSGISQMPSTLTYRHWFPYSVTYNFLSIPVGSTFTFYHPTNGYIKGATVSDNIEFSFVEVDASPSSEYKFAICRCNGDGEITING